MTSTVSLAEYCKFLTEGWGRWALGTKPENWRIERESLALLAVTEKGFRYPDTKTVVPRDPTASMLLKDITGYICWTGNPMGTFAGTIFNLAEEFAKWREAQTTATVIFAVPKENLEELMVLAAQLGAVRR